MEYLTTARRRRAASFAVRAAMFFVWLLLVFCSQGTASTDRDVRDGYGPFAPQFAIGDFDGDQKPDVANVWASARASGSSERNVSYLIDFRLSTGLRRTVGVTASAGGLQLVPRDVNGDHLLDVVVSSLLTGEPIAVLLNDGRGDFKRSEPSAFPEAFRRCDFSLSAETNEDTDRTGAVSPRPLPESGEIVSWFRSPRKVVGSLIASALHLAACSGRQACLGRAPPTFAFSR